jgi:hypothetical protein
MRVQYFPYEAPIIRTTSIVVQSHFTQMDPTFHAKNMYSTEVYLYRYHHQLIVTHCIELIAVTGPKLHFLYKIEDKHA